MNQVGCPYSRDPSDTRAGTGGPDDGSTFTNLATGTTEARFGGGNIRDEFVSEDSNEPATLSMANTGAPNTGGSQIFINVADNWRLDWFSEGESRHPVFGRVTDRYDICVEMSKVKTDQDEKPLVPIKVLSVTISGMP